MRARPSRLAALSFLALLPFARDARAQLSAPTSSDADVPIQREPPFDRWCVAPVCAGDPQQRPSLLKLPAAIEPNASQGAVEQTLRRWLSEAIVSEVKGLLGPAYNRAVEDVADALITLVASGQERAEHAKGLGAAVARGGLTYYMDRVVAPDAACVGPHRFDALYEGLAISVPLAPLEFPKSKKAVPAGCVETAKRTARAVDEAVLQALLTEQMRRDAAALVKEIDDARRSCAALPNPAAATLDRLRSARDALAGKTVGETRRALMVLYSGATVSLQPPPTPDDGGAPAIPAPASSSPAEQRCTQAIAALSAIDPARLDPLAANGLETAVLSDLVAPMSAEPNPRMQTVVRLATGQSTEEDVRELVRSLAASLLAEAGLPANTPVLKDALTVLPNAVVVKDGTPTIDPTSILTFLGDKYGGTPWMFELNGGIPNVDFTQQKVVADLSVGYSTKKLGLVGRGWIDTYDIDSLILHDDYTHAGGSLEGWWLSGDQQSKVRFELRASGAFDYYDTTSYPLVNGQSGTESLTAFYDYDSRMARGSLLVGVRYGLPSDRFSLQFLGGGGGQYEDPDTTRFTGGNNFSLNSYDNFSMQGSARLLVHVRVIPRWIGMRFGVQTQYFSITREDLVVASTSGTLSTTSTVNQDQQLEFHGRVFLDADMASVGGFVPALFAGIDYLGIQGNANSASNVSTTIPVLGVGIVRQGW